MKIEALRLVELMKPNLRTTRYSKEEYCDLDAEGKPAHVRLSDIWIHPMVQRGLMQARIHEIAKSFTYRALGIPSGILGPNGRVYVYDGEQRSAAMIERGDIKKTWVMITGRARTEDEALAMCAFGFYAINCLRGLVSSVHKFTLAVLAGMQPYVAIANYLTSLKLKVAGRPHVNGSSIRFPTDIVRLWNRDPGASKKALAYQQRLAYLHIDQLSGRVHRALWQLYFDGQDLEPYFRTLNTAGGIPELEAVIGKWLETNRKGSDRAGLRNCGEAFIDWINVRVGNSQRMKWNVPRRRSREV